MNTPPAAARGGLPPLWRVPLLMLGFAGLFVGVTSGLARLGWTMPEVSAAAAALHGPLMICAFFGVVISLERAVAIGRGWAYAGPMLSGAGGVAAILGQTGLAATSFIGGSLVLLIASLDVWRRQRAMFTTTLVLGAACWVVGNVLWRAGWSVHDVVPWWLAFLILTIAGERLELSRFMPPSKAALRWFAAIATLLLVLLLASSLPGELREWSVRGFGVGLLALAVWLVRYDIARRTVLQSGLTRYIALCLLSGYGWLALGGVVMAIGGLQPGSPAYDAALHALLLGFVFSMVFGHAPIVFPAVLRVALPYHPVFYGPLVLLHLSLALRLLGDAGGGFALRHWGAMGSALALASFIVTMASAVLRSRRDRRKRDVR